MIKSYLNYLRLAGVLAVAIALGVLYYQRASLKSQVKDLTNQRDEVLAVNEAQTRAMAKLNEQRQRDAEALEQFVAEVRAVNSSDQAARRRLANVERTNADVRSYLSGAVPDAVGCVLSDAGCGEDGGGGGAPARTTPQAVRAAGGR